MTTIPFYVIINITKKERTATMLNFIVEHKYCKMIKVIQGYNVWNALKSNGLDINVWKIKEVYR